MKLTKVLQLIAFMLLFPIDAICSTTELTIHGHHGKLSAILTSPDTANYPLVIFCHGFTSNKEFPIFEKISDKLAKAGIASLRFDFNGHGKSEGNFEDMTVINEISDVQKVIEYSLTLKDVSSISLAGHSQGGVVAAMLAGEMGLENIRSLLLLAPAAVLRDDALRGIMFGKKYDPLNPPEFFELPFPEDNPLKIGREYILTAQTLPIYETSRKYKGPLFLIHGTADTVVPYTYSQRFKYELKNSELYLIDGENHAFSVHTDEAINAAVKFLVKTLLEKNN